MIVERRLHKMELQCYFCGIAMTDDEMKVPHLDGQAHPECQEEYINAQLYEEK